MRMGERWFPKEDCGVVLRRRGSRDYTGKNYPPTSRSIFGETEAQRDVGTCLSSHGELVTEVKPESRAPQPQPSQASA